MSLFEIAAKGGPLMLVLLLLSLISIAIIIERYIVLSKKRKKSYNFNSRINQYIKEGNLEEVKNLCKKNEQNALARVITKGLNYYDKDYREMEKVVELSAKNEIHDMERKLGTLATFSAIAPLIGFLGTVTGMVKVFMKIAETGGGVDISLLASGIWEALITTIGGLTVGIITILFYNHMVGSIEQITRDIEDFSNDVIFKLRSNFNASKSE